MTEHFNRKSQTARRKALRRSMPKAEVVLWTHLSRSQALGYKFRRQYSVDNYIVDFYCPRLKLAIEVDGETHLWSAAEVHDAARQRHIEQFGIRFLRFTNVDVYDNLNGVLIRIAEVIKELAKSPTSPLSPP